MVELNTDLRVAGRTRELDRLSAQLAAANAGREQLSLHDGLTSIANRRAFDEYLAEQLAVARRHARSLALVIFDVDHFKEYNDSRGYQEGDACLRKIAITLESCCRRPADMAARYGGEEFVMILPDTNLAGAVKTAETARNAVARLDLTRGRAAVAAHVTISGGVAVVGGTSGVTIEQLISSADHNLFQAKRLGRNRIVSVSTDPDGSDLKTAPMELGDRRPRAAG